MSRRHLLALVVYAGLVGSLFTPLYEPLTTGRDDSWAMAVVVVGAHIGVGAAVDRPWVLLLPVLFAVAAFFADGAEALSLLILVFGIPGGLLATALGRAGAAALRRHAVALAVTVFGCTLIPVIWATIETAQRATAPHVSGAVQARLPTDESLGNLCPGAETPRKITRRLQRQVEVLIRELDRHPNWLVAYVYYYSDDPPERRNITVLELAEEQLRDLETGGDCVPELQRRIRAALD